MKKIILDLCGGTGAWSKPYLAAGFDVRLVTLPEDVRLYYPGSEFLNQMNRKSIYGILAAPPCCHLAGSGARWWKEKGESKLLEALSIVDACLRIIMITKPVFWCIENPVGRLIHYIGPPVMYFHPYEYGDPYQKKTCLWGNFNKPLKNIVEPTDGQKIWKMAPSEKRKELRSITPPNFAQAFFEANH